MRREKINSKSENFIGCWKIDDPNLFEGLIQFFENNPNLQKKGSIVAGINQEKKKTTDITIDPVELNKKEYLIFYRYFEQLHKCYLDYKLQWPFLNENLKTLDIPSFNLQKYNPGDHFSHIHAERNSYKTMHRVFAWMTYLNDIEFENGETSFSHFDVKVKPQAGRTLIWPAEWTHAHKGEILREETKYIITGWMCYPLD